MRCPVDYAEREHAHQRGIEELRDDAIEVEFSKMIEEQHESIRFVVDSFAESCLLPQAFTEDWLSGSLVAHILLSEGYVRDKVLPELERRIKPEWDDWP